MPESLFVGVALVLAVGVVMRVFGTPSLISGMEPVVAPELAAEFVGDFLVGVALLVLAVGLVDQAVGLPEAVWLVVGLAVVAGIAAMPTLAGWYARRRDASEDV